MHWRFLELSLPTADIQASLGFYRDLGFAELETGDIRNYAYAVVSDGRVALGLHAAGLDVPALSFVRPDTANWARQLEAAGFELAFQRLGSDAFHECAIVAPGGSLAVLMEAPTFSGRSDDVQPLTGSSSHLGLYCPDLTAGLRFWELAGLVAVTDENETQDDAVELAAPALRLRLARRGPGSISLHFPFPEPDWLQRLSRIGLAPQREGDCLVLTAPEGTRLEFPLT
jgi:catechol 2,3-dioxygenase-like lactoylglutathione lyase family enzyme